MFLMYCGALLYGKQGVQVSRFIKKERLKQITPVSLIKTLSSSVYSFVSRNSAGLHKTSLILHHGQAGKMGNVGLNGKEIVPFYGCQ